MQPGAEVYDRAAPDFAPAAKRNMMGRE